MNKILNILIKNSLIICLLLSSNLSCFAQNVSLTEKGDQNSITFYTGTFFKAVLQQRISTVTNNVGDRVELITSSDLYSGENVCLPKDTKFIGKIVKLEKPKIGSNGSILVLFDILKLPEDQNIKIMAKISTKKGDGIIGGEQTLRSMYRPMIHSVEQVGGYVQMLPAGPREMGKDTEILPGTEIVIVLEKPLTFSLTKE